jgi:uncharacterized protein
VREAAEAARAAGAEVAGVHVLRDLMVAMRDGVRLATDVYLPTDAAARPLPGPFPTILERTPYGKAETSRSEIDRGMAAPRPRPEVAAFFARHGYAVVFQDCRGRHGSEGVFTKYLAEAPDGFDTLAWMEAQPWCDGRVGTMGLSYAAHTQMALACLAPPALRTMVLDSGGFSNAHQCGIRQGGAFELKQVTWAFNHAKESPEARADPLVAAALEGEDLAAWFAALPWIEGHSPLRHAPDYERYLFDQWRHGVLDDYWRQAGIYAAGFYDNVPDIPVLLLSSWYDAYVRTTFENYAGLTRPGRTSPVKAIMGPWLHGNRTSTYAGDVSFGEAAALDGAIAPNWLSARLAWFERHLKNAAGGPDRSPAARLFLMGGGPGGRNRDGRLKHGGRWIEADGWPPPEARSTPFFCHSDGRLSPEAPPADGAPLAYDHDPREPVPTIGGALTSGEPIFSGGGFDQVESERFFGCRRPGLPLAARPDVLVFQTEPLSEDVAVVGPITVRLWIASSARDTDFTVKLIDVHPPTADDPKGFALNLTDGILRCRYRESWEWPSPMEPRQVYAITIEPFATANLFRQGHRIRLDIASSNFPKFDVNPQSGEAEGSARRRVVATNTVFGDAARPSQVVLPIVPSAALRALMPA